MKIIRDYIEVLFLQVPVTDETKQMKEDLLGTAEDHYYGLIEDGTSEKEAIGIVISDFGTIDEILKELNIEKEEIRGTEMEDNLTLSIDNVFSHWQETRRFSFGIAVGFLLVIGAFVFSPFLPYGGGGFITILGLLLMLLFCAVGFLFVVINGHGLRKKIQAIKQLTVGPSVKMEALEQSENYRKSYLTGLSTGIIAYAVSLPMGFFFSDILEVNEFGISIFMALCALGTFCIIYVLIIQREFQRIIHFKEKTQRKTFLNKKARRFKYNEEIY